MAEPHKQITHSEWLEQYAPTRDQAYPTFLEIPLGIKPTHIWTLIDSGEEDDEGFSIMPIASGIHHVNNMGFYVTKKSHDDEFIEVLDE